LAKSPVKKPAFFFDGLFGVLGLVDDGTMDGDRIAGLSMSVGASLGEGQKVECSGEVGLVETVVFETLVDRVLIDSESEDLLR